MKRMILMTAIVVAATNVLTARAELIDIKWNEGTFSHKASVAPIKFLEVCGKLKKDERIGWRFTGSGPSDFNIHYHVGEKVVYAEARKDIANADSALAVPVDQDYCWMWTNKSAQAIDVEVTLTRTLAGAK